MWPLGCIEPSRHRNGLSHDLATALLADLRTEVDFLDRLEGPLPLEGQPEPYHH